MAVGALEPQFFAQLLKGLEINESSIGGNRLEKSTWKKQAEMYTAKFKSKTRAEWEKIFDGTDACCTPVLTQRELESGGFDQRPIVTLKSTPSLAMHEGEAEGRPPAEGQGIGVAGNGWDATGLKPSDGGEDILATWMGWSKGRHYQVKDGGLEFVDKSSRPKL
jgi:alpha-methylacyl-CoA racemase